MKVIGSGFGRTGTLSLKVALEQLGFAPCYHMQEVMKRPFHIKAWHDVALGKPADWPLLLADFEAIVDFPGSIYYKELLQVYPDAKVIHTTRDPERWYRSTNETIFQAASLFPSWLQRLVPILGRLTTMQERIIWQKMFEGHFGDRQRAIEIFHEHSEEVKRVVPEEQLLVFSVKEGWEPLCRFLEVAVPNTPFPHVNNRQIMQRRMKAVQVLARVAPVITAVLLLLGLYGLVTLLG